MGGRPNRTSNIGGLGGVDTSGTAPPSDTATGVGADRSPRTRSDRALAGYGGFAGLIGDPIGLAAAGRARRARRKDPGPQYDASISTGGPFEETPYTGPTMQAGGGPTSNMDLTQAGPAESYFAQNQGLTTAPSLSETYARKQAGALGKPGATQRFNQQAMPQLMQQGAGESFYAQNQGRFNQPTFSQQAMGNLGGPPSALDSARGALGGLSNNLGQEYKNLGSMPNFDAYYDRARDRLAGGLNDQLSARGQYGSSAGLDQISQGLTDLNAAQANREADFAMQQAQQRINAAQSTDAQATQRAQMGLDAAGQSDQLGLQYGNQRLTAAGQADQYGQSLLGMGAQTAQQAQQLGLSRMGLGGQLAGQQDQDFVQRQQLINQIYGNADAARLNRFGAGMQGAAAAGGERFGRIGQAFDTQMAAQNSFLNTLTPSLMGMVGQDRDLFESGLAAEAGLTDRLANQSNADLAWETQRQQQNINTGFRAMDTGASLGSTIFGAGG